jgi:flavin-binding protein dodecin
LTDYIESGAIKVIEVIGVSPKSFEDAIDQAVAKASESINGISGVEVQSLNAKVEDGKVMQYRASLKLAFTVR